MPDFRYFIVYKPYNMLSQFTQETATQITLQNLPFSFPKDVYPVGRLDSDSEGLLLLTNDTKLNHALLNPQFRHKRTYWVQVEGAITETALQQLAKGVKISINGKSYLTEKAEAQLLSPEPNVPERNPPIRFRQNIPTSWIALTLTEGKNRQVRRMTAAVGFPTLRLIRAKIGNLTIGEMQPSEVVEWEREELMGLLMGTK